MKKLTILLCMVLLTATAAVAQKNAPYIVSSIKIVTFDEVTGKFGDEVTKDSSFGNDLSLSFFATIEISGEKGEYVPNRMVRVNVTEGKKEKLSRVAMPGILNDNGKYYIPIWIYGPVCDNLKITASVTGQTKVSTLSRSFSAYCGE
ncbi:MAG: hypothetical protein JO053_10450 [Acidobacteria bacterium]|nr:hypothetical protein [Acidobacteriota bacterium]